MWVLIKIHVPEKESLYFCMDKYPLNDVTVYMHTFVHMCV